MRGGATTAIGQLLKIGVQAAGVLTLSRLLRPKDFGLLALLVGFVAAAELLRDLGLSMAALQAPTLNDRQASNLFWLNVSMGSALALALLVGSHQLAQLMHEPRLRPAAPAIAFVVLVTSAEAQFRVHLARRFRYVSLAVTEVAAELSGLVVATYVAVVYRSYWALILEIVVSELVRFFSRAIASGWLPGLPGNAAGTSELWKTGMRLMATQLIGFGASNTDTYTIGYRFGSTALGVYNRAFQLTFLPANQILAPLANVSVPVLSRARHQKDKFDDLVLRTFFGVAAPVVGTVALVAALSGPIVNTVLGPNWRRSADVLQILAVAAGAQALCNVGYWSFLAAERSSALLRYTLITKPILIASIIVGSLWGVEGTAMGFAFGFLISWPICFLVLHREGVWTSFTILELSGRLAIAGLGAYVVSAMSMRVFSVPGAAALPLGGAAGGTVYIAALAIDPATRPHVVALARSIREHLLART